MGQSVSTGVAPTPNLIPKAPMGQNAPVGQNAPMGQNTSPALLNLVKSKNAPNGKPATSMMNIVKSTNQNKSTNGFLSGLLQSIAPLESSGPYDQIESAGMMGKAYSIPTVNPVDGSYMPVCAQGNCIKHDTIKRNDGKYECLKYGQPSEIPPSNLLDSAERHSCGFDKDPVAMFGNDRKPTYHVYWAAGKKPKTGGKSRKHRKASNKTRRSKN